LEIYESSRFATELGAAIHLPPNVNAVLHRFGLDPSSFGANDTEWVINLSLY
jgi:salicylate hydroxylase